MLKTGVGSVTSFTSSDGKIYFPGDIVTLPSTFKGEAWLEPIDIEPIKTVEPSKPEVMKIIELPKPSVETAHTSPEPIPPKEKPHHK